MPSASAIEKLRTLEAKHGKDWTDEIDPDEFFEAFFELHDEMVALKAQIASGHAGAKVTEIDPEHIAKTAGQV